MERKKEGYKLPEPTDCAYHSMCKWADDVHCPLACGYFDTEWDANDANYVRKTNE